MGAASRFGDATRRTAAILCLGAGCEAGGAGNDEGSSSGGTPTPPACFDFDVDTCELLYPATYENVFERTLEGSCGQLENACHSDSMATGARGGFWVSTPEETLQRLLELQLIAPGDPLCSPLFVRLVVEDPQLRMPPGKTGLEAPERCSVAQWIAGGARP